MALVFASQSPIIIPDKKEDVADKEILRGSIESQFSLSPTPTEQFSLNLNRRLEHAVIGAHQEFFGPFGKRRCIYMDYTASGKSVSTIENFISEHILPNYANTHTTTTRTSLQTTLFRDESRNIIRKVVGATEEDEVIFCGSGATAAIHKLVHHCRGSKMKPRKLIVFVGSYEHHSNILPWREAAAKIIQVPLDIYGNLDIDFLHANLKRENERKSLKKKLIVGCFSAGSNITGALTDDILITSIMHEYGGFAFWDYAAAAPHIKIRMNPSCGMIGAKKDAIFFSGHKFLGGPQTPGVLVVKKHVLFNPVPHGVGGGTVLFSTRKNHQYLDAVHEREEGGTPDIIGSIRLGLVFRLRSAVGINLITKLEAQYCWKALQHWNTVPEIHILGSSHSPRLPIISFMIEHLESGNFLHHNYVVALLNDLFGIQCRGGCMCAGPYAQQLLGINDSLAAAYESVLQNSLKNKTIDKCNQNHEIGSLLKPGFVRLAFSYHSSEAEVDFVIKAVEMIAKEGWKLLPLYHMSPKTSSFTVRGKKAPNTMSLANFDACLYLSTLNLSPTPPPSTSSHLETDPIMDFIIILDEAASIFQDTENLFYTGQSVQDEYEEVLNRPEILAIKWFMTPMESFKFQTTSKSQAYTKRPKVFSPVKRFVSSINLMAHNASIPRMIVKEWWVVEDASETLSEQWS
ncbi:unnamed protein product [Orchesella dallaii]|uniref:Aminotransferase class V domain-containing protein n=1 Tax=Orchesella dallaii TaxID=48710 RepID=A0ABP1RTH7_9HEXA